MNNRPIEVFRKDLYLPDIIDPEEIAHAAACALGYQNPIILRQTPLPNDPSSVSFWIRRNEEIHHDPCSCLGEINGDVEVVQCYMDMRPIPKYNLKGHGVNIGKTELDRIRQELEKPNSTL